MKTEKLLIVALLVIVLSLSFSFGLNLYFKARKLQEIKSLIPATSIEKIEIHSIKEIEEKVEEEIEKKKKFQFKLWPFVNVQSEK